MGKAKKTIEELQQAYAVEGYKLLTNVYTQSQAKMPIQCPNGHINRLTQTEVSRFTQEQIDLLRLAANRPAKWRSI